MVADGMIHPWLERLKSWGCLEMTEAELSNLMQHDPEVASINRR
jgi:hypothetical protein